MGEEGEEFIRAFPEFAPRKRAELLFVPSGRARDKLAVRVPQQDGHGQEVLIQEPLLAVAAGEFIIHGFTEGPRPAVDALPVHQPVAQCDGVDRPGLLKSPDPEELKEPDAPPLRLLKGRGQAEVTGIGRGEGAALDDRPLKQALIGGAGQLGTHAHTAGGLAADGDIARIPAEGRDIALHPAGGRLLVQEAEIGRRLR